MTTRRVGIDVGGTKFLGVVLDEHGTVIDEQRRPTPKGPDAIIDGLVEFARELQPTASIGVGVPGLVTRDGVLRAAPNLVDINDFAVGRLLRERLDMTVHVDNDATCAAVAEWQVGAAKDAHDAVVVTLGTGIGGGIVAGGALLRGANGFTGEIGHMVVDPNGPLCPCGRNGCWERYASGSGLAMLARQAVRDGRLERVRALVGGAIDEVRGEHVQTAAREGDAEAVVLIDEFARWVALGLVNLANILDPDLFVIGGGLAASGDLYLQPIKQWFGALLYSPSLRPHPLLVVAHFGERAGAVGAALLADVH